MANKYFDFGKLKRSFYNTKLYDGTTLIVEMPKKRTFEKMQEVAETNKDDNSIEAYNKLLELMAEILSNNRNKKKITVEYLEKAGYTIEDIVTYISNYTDFVNSISKDPN